MKPDDFEKRLQRQSPREIPAAWREQVLGAAQSAQLATNGRPTATEPRRLQKWPGWAVTKLWSELFWPSRFAWGGIAAAWFLMLVVNQVSYDGSSSVRAQIPPPSPELLQAAQAQRRMLAELADSGFERKMDRARNEQPRPHSRRETEIAFT
jgi:hypothetical protein